MSFELVDCWAYNCIQQWYCRTVYDGYILHW